MIDLSQTQLNRDLIGKLSDASYQALALFKRTVTKQLSDSEIAYVNEQRVDIGGHKQWLYCVANERWALFYFQKNREIEAYYKMGIFPSFKGVLCHDYWEPYFELNCQHAYCDDKLMAELAYEAERDYYSWSRRIALFLTRLDKYINDFGTAPSANDTKIFLRKYRKLIRTGIIETTEPSCLKKKGRKMPEKKTRSQKLLDRMMKHEKHILMFMNNIKIQFFGNLAKDDIKKINLQSIKSNCLSSPECANIFLILNSYLLTCSKQGMNTGYALVDLINGRLPNLFEV